jgi:putative two-component system response regulator
MRYTVLAVDDMQDNLDILESILEDEYAVQTALSGVDALIMMKKGPMPDLVIMDKEMDKIDGFEALKRMKLDEDLAKIPVIFATSASDIESQEQGLALGAVDYLSKPYEPRTLLRKVHNHIELKACRDSLERMRDSLDEKVKERTAELKATHSAIILGMSLLSESRDQETGSHIARIQRLTQIIAARMQKMYPDMLTRRQVELFTTYSPLHDVGKVGVPDAVLQKHGKLTNEEFEQMKAHTTSGGDILREITRYMPDSYLSSLTTAIEIAECHHERYDGTGYPNGLMGEEIPLAARIVSVADVYDALRSPRSYKPAFSHQQAMDIMLKGDGRTSPTHFDPVVLTVFQAVHAQLCEAYDKNPDPRWSQSREENNP